MLLHGKKLDHKDGKKIIGAYTFANDRKKKQSVVVHRKMIHVFTSKKK